MRHLFSLAAVLALSGPALACVNDTELRSHEREFRSQYQESQYEPPQPMQTASNRPYYLGGAGVLMALTGAGIFVRVRSQAR
ncbi:MAG: hypothetical protein J2P46_17130 [Zavarzinella sp.]|nr:hypothetical protein [Zavarzinella sp.]